MHEAVIDLSHIRQTSTGFVMFQLLCPDGDIPAFVERFKTIDPWQREQFNLQNRASLVAASIKLPKELLWDLNRIAKYSKIPKERCFAPLLAASLQTEPVRAELELGCEQISQEYLKKSKRYTKPITF